MYAYYVVPQVVAHQLRTDRARLSLLALEKSFIPHRLCGNGMVNDRSVRQFVYDLVNISRYDRYNSLLAVFAGGMSKTSNLGCDLADLNLSMFQVWGTLLAGKLKR
jgi:hypothetical protein